MLLSVFNNSFVLAQDKVEVYVTPIAGDRLARKKDVTWE